EERPAEVAEMQGLGEQNGFEVQRQLHDLGELRARGTDDEQLAHALRKALGRVGEDEVVSGDPELGAGKRDVRDPGARPGGERRRDHAFDRRLPRGLGRRSAILERETLKAPVLEELNEGPVKREEHPGDAHEQAPAEGYYPRVFVKIGHHGKPPGAERATRTPLREAPVNEDAGDEDKEAERAR